jgi:hypothetical protein
LDEDGGGGREENVSELERDMLLAFEEQEKSSSSTAPSSPCPHRHSTEPSHPQIDQEHDQSATNYGRLEELGYGSPLGSQDQEEEEPQEQQEVGVEAMREEDHNVEDPRPTRRRKLRSLSTEALPATQFDIDKYHLRLRGVRTQQFARRKTKTIQYRVVWGEYSNRYYSWIDEDDMRMSMRKLPCERYNQNLVPQGERAVIRVHQVRSSQVSKDSRKVFEYLVDEDPTWLTEDQLRISLSSRLLFEFEGKYLKF